MQKKSANSTSLDHYTIHHSQLAKITGFSENYIRQLSRRGYFPGPKRGVYHLTSVMRGLARYFQEQAAKVNRSAREDAKDMKLTLEVELMKRVSELANARLITVPEWQELNAEFFPFLRKIVSRLFESEIPAFCADKSETEIRVWCETRERQLRRALREIGNSAEQQ